MRQFVATRDEAAFGELVRRYSPLVLGVCRRTLHCRHDAEEAFQATFLVLATKAARVRVERSLGPWLYGVAYRVARRAAQKRARRREAALPDDVAMSEDALQNVAECHWRRILDDELNLLPEKFRSVVVLHYLLGKTNNEVAAELGLSVRTVEGRQRRGKELLKRRLLLRQVSLPLALAASATMQAVDGAAAPLLIEETIQASLDFINGNSQACSAPAVRLAQSEVAAMTSAMAPVSATLVTLLALGAAMTVAGGDAPAQGGGPLPLSAAVRLAVEAGGAEAADSLRVEPAAFLSEGNATETKTTDSVEGTPPEASPFAMSAEMRAESQSENAQQPPISGAGDLYQRSEMEQRIVAALESPIRGPLDFIATPLNQITAVLSEQYDVPIMFDTSALDIIAVSPETEVDIEIGHLIPLRSALHLMLSSVEDLTFVVRDDVLLITTEEAASSTLETHVYNIDELNLEPIVALEELAELIPGTVQPESWLANGTGEGAIKTLGKSFLVVNQTQAMHWEIGKFLTQLSRHGARLKASE